MSSVADKWGGGFHYDRTHPINNRVAMMAYKLLKDYCSLHSNCRVGCYLMVNGFTEFFPLSKLIPAFDVFADAAENQKKVFTIDEHEFVVHILGVKQYEQVNDVYMLKWPIYLEIVGRNLFGSFFGYSFGSAIQFKIDPNEITEVEGESLHSFRLVFNYTLFEVAFGGKQITVKSKGSEVKKIGSI